MNHSQELYLTANNSNYLNELIQKKDWQALIELASTKYSYKGYLAEYFQTDESTVALSEMTEEQILTLLDNSPSSLFNCVLERMKSLCDSHEKISNIAVKLMTNVFLHGTDTQRHLIVNILPTKILRTIIDSRIPLSEYHFSENKQEFFMYILTSEKSTEGKNFHYSNLKERDLHSGVYTYIESCLSTFPLGRREVIKELIQAFKDSFHYVDSNSNIDYKSGLIPLIINPMIVALREALQNPYFDYQNDKEIIDSMREVFDLFSKSKYLYENAKYPILHSNGNNSLFPGANIFQEKKVISPLYFYQVFKHSVELNKDNFVDSIARNFISSNQNLKYLREMNDGVYETLFNASIDATVRELIERRSSYNFEYCCKLLSHLPEHSRRLTVNLKFEECITFLESVISKIFEKKGTINVDVTAYPEICLFMLRQLKIDDFELRHPNRTIDIEQAISDVYKNSHSPLDFINNEMRNKLVIGVIRHLIDETKFSSIITSNNPTKLVSYICDLKSVQDIKLVLPEAKRGTLNKYGFLQGRSAFNQKEACLMNIVEVFLHTLRFWENNDKSLFRDGYRSYYIFVRKILMEAIRTNDIELKKAAMTVYHRFSELVSLMKTAKYLNDRIQIASLTFLDPLAVIVGSELDSKFVKTYIEQYIQPFSAQSYQFIISEVISKSHINFNYYEDEEPDNEIDNIFKQIELDSQFSQATELLLALIKQNPVKGFCIKYKQGKYDDFFISDTRIVDNIKSKFAAFNTPILDICNPFKTDYPISMNYNSPRLLPNYLKRPEFSVSHLVFLQLSQYVNDESKSYSPKTFKTNSTKQTIQIQNLIKNLINRQYHTFLYTFTLDSPTKDTDEQKYRFQYQRNISVNYAPAFFEFLNAIHKSNHSIYNTESYEIIKGAFIAQFLSEEDALQQKNRPPPKFNGFPINIQFEPHRNATNIFNETQFKLSLSQFKLDTYQRVQQMNSDLIQQLEMAYENSKKIGHNEFDEVFTPDSSIHRSHVKTNSARQPTYRMNSHKCFTFIIDSLNNCKAQSFLNDYDSLVMLETFKPFKKCGSNATKYSMLTELLDLLINEFVATKANTTRMYKDRISTFDDVYKFMRIVAQIATPNIGNLGNLRKLTTLTEKNVTEKIGCRDNKLFKSIFKNANIEQILLCMNSALFTENAETFYSYLLKSCGQQISKNLVNSLITEIVNNEKQVNDDFLVALAKCSVYPYFVGFPVPQTNIEFLKKITARNAAAKRAACANAVYYAIMNYTTGSEIPIKDIMEIIEMAHKKLPDEIIAFFCILISENASLNKMRSLPALNDLQIPSALPKSFVIQLGPELKLPKEIGQLYYNVVEKIILSGLKSKKSHIYELTVAVLNEINVGPEIQQIISPFIEKGLKEIEPSDDNEEFLRYATSFSMKNMTFKGCFDAYCEALTLIKKHSFAILKANTNLDANSAYPESFRKLENSFRTITNTIEKPFCTFKEEEEMTSVSQFCRNILPILKQNRPAIARDVYLNLENYTSIFGDELVEDMVHFYKQEKKEDALSKFLLWITRHEELTHNIPSSIYSIYNHLKSSFTVNHTIELSTNLANSDYSVRLQSADQLARMVSQDVLHHMPNAKNKTEDEIVEILSNLGIFCKSENVTFDAGICADECVDLAYNCCDCIPTSAPRMMKSSPPVECCAYSAGTMNTTASNDIAENDGGRKLRYKKMRKAVMAPRSSQVKQGKGADVDRSNEGSLCFSRIRPRMEFAAMDVEREEICDDACEMECGAMKNEQCEAPAEAMIITEAAAEDMIPEIAEEIAEEVAEEPAIEGAENPAEEQESQDIEAIQDQIKDAFDIFS